MRTGAGARRTSASPDARTSDKSDMAFACCSRFAALSRAAAKYATAVARRSGASAMHPVWTVRAEICERCPLRVVVGRVSYCGEPVQSRLVRGPEQGCGCPTREKARSPEEHCPLTVSHRAARVGSAGCDCKWCRLAVAQVR